MSIGTRLKILREAKGLTLQEVATKLGINRATVQRYESGVIPGIPSDKIEALAVIYNTTPAYIMGWEEDLGKDKELYCKNIGARIKLLRKELGISADELGAQIGKDRATIYRYEKGDAEMPISVINHLASILQTTPNSLTGWSDDVLGVSIANIMCLEDCKMGDNSISERMSELMRKQGWSYGKLSKKTGVPQSALHRYAIGETEKMSFDRLKLIADALGCTPDYLLDWDSETKKDTAVLTEKYGEVLMDEEFVGLFYKYKSLDAKQRKVVRNLIDSLSDPND